MDETRCYHCGDLCRETTITQDDRFFCCHGCKGVYEILQGHDLSHYYDLQDGAGASPEEIGDRFSFLEGDDIVAKLVEFDNGQTQIVHLYIPHIHCSSCIWILENLNRLHPSVSASQVDFPKKTLRVTYKTDSFSLKELVILLARIGYEPYLSLDDLERRTKVVDRSLLYKLGVAGFAFGNIMFLSFPEYFETKEFWLDQYKHLFRGLMFAFSIPVVCYAGRDYFISALKGIRSGLLNIDVPIALGILVLFVRSTIEILFDWGSGFFDSLSGLVFFLLLGKFFQQKTYSFLSFERDYKSYFPVAVTRINAEGQEDTMPVNRIGEGDRLLIRHGELIPVDGLLLKGNAQIDYSFVTGESQAVGTKLGGKIFAGGRQLKGAIEMEATRTVSQSYLTQLWGNAVFSEDKSSRFQTLTDGIGRRFTLAVLTIATVSGAFWLYFDPTKVLNVFTAVLIIACPCAIALAAPFALGNMLRIFGRRKFYVRDTRAIEQLAMADTAIFDKTGTLTVPRSTATYEGMPLTVEEESLLKNTLRASNHPLSRTLYELLASHDIVPLDGYEEHVGKGLTGSRNDRHIQVGSAEFVGAKPRPDDFETSVHVRSNADYRGRYVFHNTYRDEVGTLFREMSPSLSLGVLSGDKDGERERLRSLLPTGIPLVFDQRPEDKLRYIESLQRQGKKVIMVGDGLNDAGALAQSDVGIALSEKVNVFSPACDAILDASQFKNLYRYIQASRKAMRIIKWSFVLSLAYNVIGLYFAVTGQLQPVIAAILMPLSSISIVAFTTLMTNGIGKRLPHWKDTNEPKK